MDSSLMFAGRTPDSLMNENLNRMHHMLAVVIIYSEFPN